MTLMNKFLSKYRNMSKPVKASLWFTLCNIMQKGIQFVTIPIYTRMMSTEQYGEYTVFLSWYQIISIFATLNMWNYVINNGLVKYEKDKDGFVSSLQGLSTTLTAIFTVVYMLLSGVWETWTQLTPAMMVVMIAELLVMPSFEYWCAKKRFEYDFKWVVILSLMITALIPAVSIPLVMIMSEKGLAAIIGRAATSSVIYVIPFIIIMVKGRRFYNREYWRFALKFNLPLIPHFLSTMILQQSDRIMISNMCGQDKAGIYSLAYSISMVLLMVNSAIQASFVPYTYNSMKEKKYDGIRKNSLVLITIVAVLNLMLVLVAPEVLAILGTSEYSAAAYVMPPVAMSSVLMFLFNLFANIEYYFEETKFVMTASVISAVINIALNYVFISRFGFIAAGYTTLVCYAIYSAAHYFFMKIVIKKHIPGADIYNGKLIFSMMFGIITFSMLVMLIYDYAVIRIGILVVLAIVAYIKRKSIADRLNLKD